MILDQRILDLVKKYMGKLVQKKVLTSMEEVEANTNETNLVAAPVVAELNNKLGGFQPIVDPSTGKITGYKTDVGGADTVFPFSGNIKLKVTQKWRHYFTADGYLSSCTINQTISYIVEYNGTTCIVSSVKSDPSTLKVADATTWPSNPHWPSQGSTWDTVSLVSTTIDVIKE